MTALTITLLVLAPLGALTLAKKISVKLWQLSYRVFPGYWNVSKPTSYVYAILFDFGFLRRIREHRKRL